MSQIANLNVGVSPGVTMVYLSGDAGGYVGVDAAHNINLVTGSGLSTLGTPLTNTITFSLADDMAAIEALIGTGIPTRTADNTWAMNTITAGGILVGGVGNTITNVAPLTTGQILVGVTGGTPTAVGPLISGQILVGVTGGTPVAGSLASAGGTVTITPGAGTINLEAGTCVPTTFTAEDASTATPVANILNIVGTSTNGIDTTAAGNTVTIAMASSLYSDFSFINLAPATSRTVTIYNGDTDATSTAELRLSVPTAGADAMIVWEVQATRFYSIGVDNSDGDAWKLTNSSDPSSGDALISVTPTGVVTLYNDLDVTEGGTGVSTLTSHGILLGNGTGDIQATAEPSNGEILIGSTGNFPTLGTIIAGSGVSITNAAGSITIATSSGGFTWTDATDATYTLAAQNGYVTNRGGGVTYTLPASGTLGDVIKIVGKTGLATIAQNANQQIVTGDTNTTVGVGGSLAATDAGDCVSLICITAGASTVWRTDTMYGNWT